MNRGLEPQSAGSGDFFRSNDRAALWMVPALLLLLTAGCAHAVRAPGASGVVVDAETGQPVRQATVRRLEEPPPRPGTNAPARLGNVFRGGRGLVSEVYTSRKGAFTLHPAFVLDLIEFIPGTGNHNRNEVFATLQIIAPGYATNQIEVVATKADRWRRDFHTIELIPKKPRAKDGPGGDCDCP